ncbi:putative protein EARLY FLOWERING 3 [Helianthus annuus]|uniref:Uncharacterized protein n=1 Tax=Helianthus annuus TaxID=4232 RepID=A0A9K3IHR0_HELAN|nr:putative protein EARLY FLOWERING 3 [Helianthus annuus]KAJ0903183.1 putative protein EARLY FLOWERING 3 [Helianthus annuus]
MDNRSQFKSLSAKHLAKRTVQGLIGLKHFSKARRAIVNQQRVFAIQVFELHRLIKKPKQLYQRKLRHPILFLIV